MYSLYKFKHRNIGVVSDINIPYGTYIGNYFSKKEQLSSESRLIYDGWIETNPLGRYLNHNLDCNLSLVKKDDVIELYANRNIPKHTELTVNYTNIVKLINLPESLVLTYEIFNFDYIEEEVIINKSII